MSAKCEERKVVVLPNREEIVKRLRAVYDDDYMAERFYTLIAQEAGHELVAEGVVMMLTLKVYDFAEGYPPPMGAVLGMYLPQFIDALVDDKDVARDAKMFLKQAEDQAEVQRKANTPQRVEPKEPIENYELYVAVRKIAEIFFEEVVSLNDKNLRVGRCNDGVNPFYNQTDSGLFLEYYYSSPYKIWTPWGYFVFTSNVMYSGNPWKKLLPKVIERLGATLFQPVRIEKYGVIGPVYAIHRVDDQLLPEPRLREPQNFLEYEVALRAWESMTKCYEEHKPV